MKIRWFVIAWGAVVMCFGAWSMVQPLGLTQIADLFLTGSGLWAAVALRVGFGVLLWVSAPASRMPRTLRVLGALFVLGGLALPVVGLERMQGIAEWGAGQDGSVLRLVALMAVGLGAFIVWSMWPRKSEV
ncbi:MAG: hypothetical protein HKP01_07610 [Gemmatimonadetes bacterium]|nr:hypothetical protein [Gemmatimonadota bacterium]